MTKTYINDFFSKTVEELYELANVQNNKQNEIFSKDKLVTIILNKAPRAEYWARGIIFVLNKANKEKYAFLRYRENNFQQSKVDVYLTNRLLEKYNFQSGFEVDMRIQINSDKIIPIEPITVSNSIKYSSRDKVTVFPYKELQYDTTGLSRGELTTINLIRIFCPQGYGQRTMILAPATAGKTTLLITLGRGIKMTDNTILAVLLIEERPEEVYKIKSALPHAVLFAATFDEDNKRQVETTELFISYVQSKLLENKDVVCLVDSMTRITRTYNNYYVGSGKTMTGGLDPVCLEKIKKLFGLARTYLNSGSVTIFGTCLYDTSSVADDIISRELRSASNSEIVITLQLSRAGIYPAIDIEKSLTRNYSDMMDEDKYEKLLQIRRNFLELYDSNVYDAYRVVHAKIYLARDIDALISDLSETY